MKHLIFILSFLLLSVVGFSQNNVVKGTGVCYTNGEPTVSVNTDYYCEIAIDTTTGFWYEYQRDSSGGIWVFAGYRLQPTYSSGTPTFEPTDKQSYFVVNDEFELYYWKDNVWNQIAGGGGGGGADLTIGGSGPTYTIASSSGTDVTISGGGINALSESPANTLVITATEVDGSITNEIQGLTITGTKGTIRLDNGGGYVILADSSLTNEIQTIDTFEIASNILRISLSSDGQLYKTVDLSSYLDNTDTQDLTATAGKGTLRLVDGDFVVLNDSSSVNEGVLSLNTESSSLYSVISNSLGSTTIYFKEGTNFDITRSGDTLILNSSYTDTDDQTLSWNGGTGEITISEGNTIDIDGRYLQSEVDGSITNEIQYPDTFLISGNYLKFSLINDGRLLDSVSLAAYLDNTDSQSFSGSDDGTTFTLDLSGASTDISFKEGSNITITRSGTELTFAGSAAYTTEEAQDAIGAMINASLQYVDGTPLLAINDRDNGDITTSGSGLTWTIDNGVINAAKLADSAVTAIKIISNAVTTTALATNSVTNLKINDVAWSKITGTPTTLSGYGITDALSNSTTSTQDGYFGDIYLKDDTSPSHYLQITNAENLSGSNKTLSIVTGNSNRTLTFSGDATISGTNTGDQTIILTGDVTGSGTGSFAATIADNSVDGTDIALGSDAQGDIMYYDGTNWARLAAGTNGHFLKTQGAGANPTWAAGGGGSDGNGIYSGAGTIPNLTYARLGTSQANMDGFAIGNFTDSTNLEYNARERGIMFSNNAQHIHMIASDSANLMFNVVEVTNTYAGIRSDNYTFYDDDSYVRAYGGNTDQRVAIGVYKDAGTTSSTLAQFYPDSFDMRANKSIIRVDSLLFKINGSYGTAGQILTSNGYSATWENASGGYTDEQAQDAIGAMVNSSLTYTDGTPLLALASRDFGDWTTSSNGTVATIDNGVISTAKLADSAVTTVKLISNAVGTTALATGSVTTLKIASNAVDGTKIAIGSDAQGDIMYYDGTDWTRLAAGTSGHYLKTNGAGANPQWSSVSGTLSDGDKGDVTVSSSGTVWTIDNLAVTNAKINDVAWSKITGTPTTLGGYGITDALTNSTSSNQDGHFGDIYLTDDTSPSHYLKITDAENLTGDRTLSIVTGDASRTITLNGNTTLSGTNTGDQTITLTGDVTGSGTGSFATTIADNSVDGTDIALGSDAQGDIMYYDGTNWVRLAAGTNGHFLKTQGAGANPVWAAGSGGADGNGVYDGSGTSPDNTKVQVGTSIANPTDFAIGHFEDWPTISFDAHERGFALSNAGYTYLFGADSVNSIYSYTRLKDAIYSKVSNVAGTIKGELDHQKDYMEMKSTVSGEVSSIRINGDSIYNLSDQFRINADTLTLKIAGSHGTNGQALISNGYLAQWTTIGTLSDGDKGDITLSSSATVWNIDANTITTTEIAANEVGDADLRQGAAMTVIGRSANSTGNVADIATSADNQVLRRSGTTLGFGTVATGGLADSLITTVKILSNAVGTTAISSGAVTNLKLGDSAVTEIKLISNSVGTTALKTSAVSTLKIADNAVNGEKIAMGSDAQGDVLYYDGTNYARLGAGTSGQFLKTNGAGANPAWATASTLSDGDKGDITLTSSATVWTIDNDVVTFAKMQNVTANSFLANTSGSSGDAAELALSASQLAGRGSSGNLAAITLGTGLSMSGTTLSATGSGGDIVNGGNTTGATVVIGTNDNNGLNFEIQDTAALSFSTAQVATFTMSTSTTNALVDQLYIDTKTYNTAASGFGGSIMFKGESSTTESQAMATIGSYWTTATHASREAALTFQLGDNASSLAEVLKISRTDLNGFGLLTLGTSTPLEISNDKLYQAGGNYTIDVGSSGTIVHNGITKFENQLNVIEQSAPSTPSSGRGYIYEKTDNLLYFKNDAGTEFDLTATGSLSDGDKGDVDVTSSGSVWTVDTSSITTVKILDNTVANADFRQSAGLSVVGRASNSTGNVADITAGADLDVLYRDGSTLTWGKLYGASIQTNEVSLTKLQQLSANTVLGNATGSSGNVSEIALSASNLLGRGSSGNIAAITAGQGIAFTGTVLSGGVYAGSGNISDNTKAQVLRTNDFAIGYFQNYPTSVLDEDRGIWFDDEIYIYANDSTSGDFSRMYSDNGSWTTKSSNGSTESYIQNSKNYTQTYTSDGTDQSLLKIGSDSIYTYSDRYRFETDSFKVVLSGSAGTNGQVLKSNGSVIYWAADNAGGGLSDADYGDIVVTSSGTVWTIDANAVTSSKIGANEVADVDIRQSAGLSVLGRSANSTGNIADITAGSDNHVLRRSGTSIGFGTVATGGIADSAITELKLISNSVGTTALATGAVTTLKIASNSVDGTKIALGSDAQGDVMYYDGTNWARLAPGTSGQFLKTNGAASNPAWADAGASVSDGDKGDITVTSSGATWTIDNGVVTSARIADGTIVSGDVNDDHIILQGGNTIGESVVIGSNDANTVSIESNNVVRATVTGGASTGGAWTVTDVSANTNTVEDIFHLRTNSTGTAAASFGSGVLFSGESNTTDNQEMMRIRSYWTTATHASREAAFSLMLGDNGGSIAEVLKMDRVGDATGELSIGTTPVKITSSLMTIPANYTFMANAGAGILVHSGINYFSEQSSSPSTPSSGYAAIYPKTDGASYIKNDAGFETNIAGTIISPSQLTSDQDDYNPAGFAAARWIRVSSDNGMRAITSFNAGLNGEVKTFTNTGSYAIYFPSQHPDGTSTNRILYNEDIILQPRQSIDFIYDNDNSYQRWRPLNYTQNKSAGRIIERDVEIGSITAGDNEIINFLNSGIGSTATSGTPGSTEPWAFISLPTGTTSSGMSSIYLNKGSTTTVYQQGGHIAVEAYLQIPTLSNGTDSFTVCFQLRSAPSNTNNPTTQSGSIGIMYSHGVKAGNWTGYVHNGSRTEVDLGTAVAANTLYKLRFEYDKSGTEVRFYVNDTYAGRITSGLPGAQASGISAGIWKGVGSTSRQLYIPKFYFKMIYP